RASPDRCCSRSLAYLLLIELPSPRPSSSSGCLRARGVAKLDMYRLAFILVPACHYASPEIAADGALDGSTACAPGLAGAPCVLALYDRATTGCDPAAVATLTSELDARAHLGPLWADGRALFRTARPMHVAGEFNSWSTSALATAPLCGGDVIAGVG